MTILSSRIMVGLSTNRLYFGGSNSWILRWNLEFRISWQAQCLVMLEGDSCCSAHCNGRFMSDEHQSSASFFVAGAMFGEVGGWLLMPRALYWTFHVRQGSIIAVIFRCRRNIGSCWRCDSRCSAQCNGCSMSDEHKSSAFSSCQAQYLVKLGDDSWWSAHCTGRFIWDEDQSLESSFLAGAILFGQVGGWLLMLRALYWTFHVRQGSIIGIIFVTVAILGGVGGVTPVAPHIVMDVSCLTSINHQRFSCKAQYLMKLEDDSWWFHLRRGSNIRVSSRTRRNICWCWTLTCRGRRNTSWIVQWSPERRIIIEWSLCRRGQYLVMLEGISCCPALWTGRFMCSNYQTDSYFLVRSSTL